MADKIELYFEDLAKLIKHGRDLHGTEHAAQWIRKTMGNLPDDQLVELFIDTGKRLEQHG